MIYSKTKSEIQAIMIQDRGRDRCEGGGKKWIESGQEKNGEIRTF